MKQFNILLLAVTAVFSFACGDKGGDDKKDGGHYAGGGPGGSHGRNEGYNRNQVSFRSSALTALTASDQIEACAFNLDKYRGEGLCLSPLNVSGYARSASLFETSAGLNLLSLGGTRILANLEEGVSEEGAINSGIGFDFSGDDTLVTNNQLQSVYQDDPEFDTLAVELAYYKVKIHLKDKYVTMFQASYSQPFVDSDVVTDCDLLTPDQLTQERYLAADRAPGMTFQRGDYLFCVKDTADAVCEATDYQWLDLATGSLVSERPTNPKVSAWNQNQEIRCTDQGQGRVSFDLGTFGFFAKLSSKLKLRADYSHGSESIQWPNASQALGGDEPTGDLDEEAVTEPYLIYYHQNENGEAQVGTNLKMLLDFGVNDMVYIQDLRDEGEINSLSLGQVLSKIHTRGQWGFDQKQAESIVGFDPDDMADMTVNISVEVSGGTAAPVALE